MNIFRNELLGDKKFASVCSNSKKAPSLFPKGKQPSGKNPHFDIYDLYHFG